MDGHRTRNVIVKGGSRRPIALGGHVGRIDAVSANLHGLLAVGCNQPRAPQKEVTLWNLSGPEYVGQIETEFNGILSLSFSPDGKTLAVGGGGYLIAEDRRDYTPGIEIWRLHDLQKVAHFGDDLFFVKSLSFSPDGRFLLSTNYASPPGAIPSSGVAAVHLWRTSNLQQVTALAEGHRALSCASFSPDGKDVFFAHPQEAAVKKRLGSSRFSTMSSPQTPEPLLRTWNLEEKSETRPFEIYKGVISGIGIFPKGTMLATSGSVLSLWDIQKRTKIAELMDESSEFGFTHCVAFSPDGKTLAAGSGDHSDVGRPWENCGVKLWDVATMTLKDRLVHETPVYSLAFSVDGAKLVAGGDSELIVWTLDSGAVS
jgi:WD40 repeat protein